MQRFWTFGLYVSAEMLMGKLGERRKNPPIFSRGSVNQEQADEIIDAIRQAVNEVPSYVEVQATKAWIENHLESQDAA
jgi:hypothetical protein